MNEVFTITEAKARLSELISRLIYQRSKIVLTRKGQKVAVIMPFEEFQNLEKRDKGGLILARNALAEFSQEIEEMCDFIYSQRAKEKSREVRF